MASLNAQQVQALIYQAVPQADELELKIEAVGERCAVAKIPFKANLLRAGGTLSGPTQMALADAVMFAAVLGAIGEAQMAVTS